MADTISGITQLNGTPTQARVTLINTDTNTIVSSQLSNVTTGAFSFTGLAAGRYELLTLIPGYKALVDGPWVLDGVAEGADPYWANVVSLLHFDGADGSTTFIDEKGATWTVGGGAQIDTAQSQFGGASGQFSAAGDYIGRAAHADFGFGTGDFTVEAWVRRPTATAADWPIFDFRTAGAQNGLFYLSPTTGLLTYYNGGTSGGSGSAPAVDTMTHVAWARSGTTLRAFLNGVQQWATTMSGDFGSTRPCRIGGNFAGSAVASGHIDEARITKGVARYTSNFTPPTGPFPNY